MWPCLETGTSTADVKVGTKDTGKTPGEDKGINQGLHLRAKGCQRWPENYKKKEERSGTNFPSKLSAGTKSANTLILDFWTSGLQNNTFLLFKPPSLCHFVNAYVHAQSLQSCLTLCDLMDYGPPGFSLHGIFQARIVEWVAMPSSRVSSRPRNQTCISCISCIGKWILYWLSHQEKEMATHSSILAWRIPWTEEPSRLQPMGSQRVGHNWATFMESIHTIEYKFC